MQARVGRLIYFTLQHFRREPVKAAFADVLKTEFIPRKELMQLRAMRQLLLLQHAIISVPYYQRLDQDFKNDVLSAHSREDVEMIMRKMAPLGKDVVVGKEEDFISSEIRNIPNSLNRTSGSTGTPLIFPCNQQAWAYRHALFARCAGWYGVELGEPYGYFFGLHWNRASRLKIALRDFVFNRVRVSAYSIVPETVRKSFRSLQKAKVTHFIGYPSALYEFCILAHDEGCNLEKLGLKAVFTTAEPLLPFQRRLIEQKTGSRCVNTYGSVEGGFTACECPEGSMHVMVESTWLQSNESGSEALVTDSMLTAFPLINYAIGDEVKFRELGECCPCGRQHPLIGQVTGRSGEPIRLPNGRVVNANLPSYIFKGLADLHLVRRYRFVDRGQGCLELLLVVTGRFQEAHEKVIRKEIAQAFGADVPVSIQIVDEIPHLPNAKHRCYVKEASS